MTDFKNRQTLSQQLLAQDQELRSTRYKEHRMDLERAILRAEGRERIARYVIVAAAIVYMILVFAGGSRLFGSFDPWSDDATAISIGLSILLVLSGSIALLGLASYYSRFRPRIGSAREQIREAELQSLRQQVDELHRRLVETHQKEPEGRE